MKLIKRPHWFLIRSPVFTLLVEFLASSFVCFNSSSAHLFSVSMCQPSNCQSLVCLSPTWLSWYSSTLWPGKNLLYLFIACDLTWLSFLGFFNICYINKSHIKSTVELKSMENKTVTAQSKSALWLFTIFILSLSSPPVCQGCAACLSFYSPLDLQCNREKQRPSHSA